MIEKHRKTSSEPLFTCKVLMRCTSFFRRALIRSESARLFASLDSSGARGGSSVIICSDALRNPSNIFLFADALNVFPGAPVHKKLQADYKKLEAANEVLGNRDTVRDLC